MLTGALRFMQGQNIYAPPSLDYIPQLYTPLYPLVVSALGRVFGLSYAMARAVSIISVLVVLVLAARAVWSEGRTERCSAWAGATSAVGFVAAAYPWVDCFYDLARVDSLAMALGLGGLVLIRAGARRGHAWIALSAVLLSLSFFAKQTGFLLLAAGGAALAVMNFRRLPTYVFSAGLLGGGGSWLLNRASDGWFWTYVYRVHQHHDWNTDRFWASFELILWQFPAMTFVVAAGVVAVVAQAASTRRLPSGGAALLYWAWLYAAATVIGGIGYGTQWAVYNAFIPAIVFGAVAAGAAVVPLAASAGAVFSNVRTSSAAAAICLALLAGQLTLSFWVPRTLPDSACATASCARERQRIGRCWHEKRCVLLPSAEDRAAGDRLIERLRAAEGDVFIPSHPFYAHLAGKPPHVHRIGIKDVTWNPGPVEERQAILRLGHPPQSIVFHLRPRPPLPPGAQDVRGLAEALRDQRFALVVLDDGEALGDYPHLASSYRLATTLSRTEAPAAFSGKPTIPRQVLVPVRRRR